MKVSLYVPGVCVCIYGHITYTHLHTRTIFCHYQSTVFKGQ